MTTFAVTIAEAAREIAGRGYGPPRTARDPVNPAMINNWLEALGDSNPRYAAEGLAPPAMAQVWTMRGLHPQPEPEDPLTAMTAVLDAAGFTSVVATNCTQTYHRYLRHGEQLAVRTRLVEVTGPKRTALGEGWFVTTESTWYAGEEAVAGMLFRVLKFRPAAATAAATAATAADVLRPVISQDTAFFWAGTARRELRVQRCLACGRLRHPPGPACPDCGGTRLDHVLAAGTGEIYSYVVHHHPPVPGHRCPFVIVLVELPEGVRMLGELLGAAPPPPPGPPDGRRNPGPSGARPGPADGRQDPGRSGARPGPADGGESPVAGAVKIGAPVRVDFVRIDDELTLPVWRLGDQP
jgi:uncharacterized protein